MTVLGASALPFLRWPGGKRWIAPVIAAVAEEWQPAKYVEPFLGGGAVLLSGGPWAEAQASDVNQDLIATFQAVRDEPEDVRQQLLGLDDSRATYDLERRAFGTETNAARRAAAFIYLNRCAYGGIYRTNRAGEFNVPYGGARSLEPLKAEGALNRISGALQGVELTSESYADALQRVDGRALVYCDPAYVAPRSGVFDRYQPGRFDWNDQLALANLAVDVASRGALVLVSNGCHPEIDRAFAGAEAVVRLSRRAQLPKSASKRVEERLFIFGADAIAAAETAIDLAEGLGLGLVD